ncbi:MAG: 50S ribosomal protein L24 [Kiritimatiellae bacterium]|nr:50S ribosomal protein L24 [Kiritimatiellia bacterium]
MSNLKIKKGDTVIVIAGTSKGQTGSVLKVMPETEKVLVEGLNLAKKTVKRTQDNPQGGFMEIEAPIAISNLMLYCSKCKKGVKVSVERQTGSRVRKCKGCEHSFDS